MNLVDAHIHVDHLDDPLVFAQEAQQAGMGLFSNTVTPEGFAAARDMLAPFDNIRVGLGLHPWWIEEDSQHAAAQLESFMALLPETDFVGEIGLDFAPAHQVTQEQQVAAFTRIVADCAQQGGKVLSVHCVHAYDQLLDILESTDVTRTCACVIHWFSGTHDQLLRARDLGCWFSVGERMLSSKRGRAYVKAMPRERLLLETDAPPLGDGLAKVAELLSDAEGVSAISDTLSNGMRLLGFK